MNFKFFSVVVITLFSIKFAYAQGCGCPTDQAVADDNLVVLKDGVNDPDYNQNSANVFCIPAGATYTGNIPNSNGGSLSVCGTWDLNANTNVQLNGAFTILVEGGIDAQNFDLVINGNQTTMVNNGTIANAAKFEVAEAQLINNGDIYAFDAYLHGVVTNNSTGLIVSTNPSCSGTANSTCGFFIGNKGTDFVNDGEFRAVDLNSSKQILGDGSVEATGSLTLQQDYNNSNSTNNTFRAPVVTLQNVNSFLSGNIYTDVFDCGNSNLQTSVCNYNGTAALDISSCNPSSSNTSSCTALPVTIELFEIKEQNNVGLIIWKSEEEIAFSHYELQVSDDNRSWKAIATFEGKGSGSIYQSSKIKKLEKLQYFRLKMIDLNGSFEILDKTLTLRADLSSEYIKIFPNPVGKGSQIRIQSTVSKPNVLYIYDLNGKRILTKVVENNEEIILENHFAPGTYVIEMLSNTASHTQKLIIQ